MDRSIEPKNMIQEPSSSILKGISPKSAINVARQKIANLQTFGDCDKISMILLKIQF